MRDAPFAAQGAPDRSVAKQNGPSPNFILPEGKVGSQGVESMPFL